jgi:hypothetical protein
LPGSSLREIGRFAFDRCGSVEEIIFFNDLESILQEYFKEEAQPTFTRRDPRSAEISSNFVINLQGSQGVNDPTGGTFQDVGSLQAVTEEEDAEGEEETDGEEI